MPKRTNAFQRLIHWIEGELQPSGWSVRESVLLAEPASGTKREIDILISGDLGGHQVSIAVECRRKNRKADIEWIDQLIGKYSKLPTINKIIAVSWSGFTESATKKAFDHGMEVLSLGEAISTRWIPKTQVRAIRAREIHEPTIKFLNIAVIEMEQMKSEESAEHLPSCIVKIDGLNEMNVLHFAQMMIYQDKWRRRIDEERDKHLPFRARSDSSEDENACTIPLTMIFDNPQAIIFPSGRIYSLLEIHIVTEHKVSDQLMPITRSLYNDAEIIHGEHQLSFGTMSFAALYREKQQIKLRCSFEINKSISENITSTN